MKIQEVTIEGYQSHTNSTFRLSPGLTVITGPSDAGKTAIIRALRWFAFNEPTGEAFLHTIRNPDGSIKEELQKLIEQYGADAVAKAAAEALNKHVPTINTPVVTDEQLINTISQLDAAVTDILEAGRKNEETYQNKVELARRARQLETSIQITEAEAINTICGIGKDAYGIIPYSDGTHVRVAVTNDTQRDAFRRHFSADERKELASVEADIKAIEVSQFKAREDLDAKKEALSCIRAKAQLQAAALTYLA